MSDQAESLDIHRIGGGGVENLRIKPTERTLNPPGITLLRSITPSEAARQMRRAFPKATKLQEMSGTVGSTTAAEIRGVGFEILEIPSTKLPNHLRLVHPEGLSGFSDENLRRLSSVFRDRTGH